MERDDRGRTLLYVAARRGRADLLRRALDACKGAGVNLANRAGKTPLHAAAVCGDAECVEMLFYRDASVDARDDNERTPLWAACRRGNAEAVACLCRLGADPNAQDASLVPPLVCAAAHGEDGAVHALLTSARGRVRVDEREMLGCTALWAAAEGGELEAATTLLGAGADPDARNAFGRPPLVAAAVRGHAEMCVALIADGADANLADDDGETACYVAAFENKVSALKALLKVAPDLDPDAVNAEGNTPLIGACWAGNPEAVRTLLEHGARLTGRSIDLERANEDGRTALIAACWRGEHACARLLLDAGARVDATDLDGRSALWAAARAGDAVSVKMLLSRGADPSAFDRRRDAFSAGAGVASCTPLFAAVWQEEHDAAEALLAGGADPFVGDAEGRTPMSLVNSGDDAHAEHTRRIRELLLDRCEEIEADPKTLRRAKATRERRDAEQRRRGEEARAARAREAERAENEHAERRRELREVNAAFDALRVASEENRRAQQAVAFAENPRLNVRRPKATKPRDKKEGAPEQEKDARGDAAEKVSGGAQTANGNPAIIDPGAPPSRAEAQRLEARANAARLEARAAVARLAAADEIGGDGATRRARGLTAADLAGRLSTACLPRKSVTARLSEVSGSRRGSFDRRSLDYSGRESETRRRPGGDRAGARDSFATLRDEIRRKSLVVDEIPAIGEGEDGGEDEGDEGDEGDGAFGNVREARPRLDTLEVLGSE